MTLIEETPVWMEVAGYALAVGPPAVAVVKARRAACGLLGAVIGGILWISGSRAFGLLSVYEMWLAVGMLLVLYVGLLRQREDLDDGDGEQGPSGEGREQP